MAPKKHSDAELRDFAEQILLSEKDWADFDYLDDDEKAKLLVIIQRGQKALQPEHEIARVRKVVFVKGTKGEREVVIYTTKKTKGSFVRLAKRVGFQVFPLELIVKESMLFHRKWFEAINRRLSPGELAMVLLGLEDSERASLLQAVSQNLGDEIKWQLENLPEDLPEQDLEHAMAKYSIATMDHLGNCEELSPSLKDYLDQYRHQFLEDLREYCCDLPRKMGILKTFKSFTSEMWVKLVGLTPRVDMANIALACNQDLLKKLMLPLPDDQKRDLKELIAQRRTKEKAYDFRVFLDTINSLKEWVQIIRRVTDAEEEDNY